MNCKQADWTGPDWTRPFEISISLLAVHKTVWYLQMVAKSMIKKWAFLPYKGFFLESWGLSKLFCHLHLWTMVIPVLERRLDVVKVVIRIRIWNRPNACLNNRNQNNESLLLAMLQKAFMRICYMSRFLTRFVTKFGSCFENMTIVHPLTKRKTTSTRQTKQIRLLWASISKSFIVVAADISVQGDNDGRGKLPMITILIYR